MRDNFTQLTERLGQLVAEIMKETDLVKCDQLGDEIWRVLEERERLLRSCPTATTAP